MLVYTYGNCDSDSEKQIFTNTNHIKKLNHPNLSVDFNDVMIDNY